MLSHGQSARDGYADLCYLHFPSPDSRPPWRALERLAQERRCRALGISNFEMSDVEQLLSFATIKPRVLQNQFSLYEPMSKSFTAWLRSIGIVAVSAASINPANFARISPLSDSHVLSIAALHGKTASQVMLRWILQRGVAVIPRSRRNERIMENSQ